MNERDVKTRQAFLDSIKCRRGAEALTERYIFADWLEERGADDEATAQRQWDARKQDALDWMADFAAGAGRHCLNYGYEEVDVTLLAEARKLDWKVPEQQERIRQLYQQIEDRQEWVDVTVEMLMDAARNWVETCKDDWGEVQGDWFVQNGEEGLRDKMSDPGVKEKFWECYQILAGEEVPAEKQGHVFSCSC